jgi:hypothetical protein
MRSGQTGELNVDACALSNLVCLTQLILGPLMRQPYSLTKAEVGVWAAADDGDDGARATQIVTLGSSWRHDTMRAFVGALADLARNRVSVLTRSRLAVLDYLSVDDLNTMACGVLATSASRMPADMIYIHGGTPFWQ